MPRKPAIAIATSNPFQSLSISCLPPLAVATVSIPSKPVMAPREPKGALDIPPLLSDISVMTEITVTQDLPPAIRRFVLHWGDMGGQWGVNRSVSQIHALLYLAETPLTAEDIAET